MDKLKKYLKDNEALLELDIPDVNSIWERIELGSTKKPAMRNRVRLLMRYAGAACFIALVGISIVFVLKDNEKKSVQQAAIVKETQPIVNNKPVKINPSPIDTKTKKIKDVKNLILIATKEEDGLLEAEASRIGKSYVGLINLQLKRLNNTEVYAGSPGYFNDFKLQLKQMDKDEALIHNDMKLYGFSDPLLEQLINIYQQKLNLLKNLQATINKMNKRVKEKQQTSDQIPSWHINI